MRDSQLSLDQPDFDVRWLSVFMAPRAFARAWSSSEMLACTVRPNVLVIGPMTRIEATVASIAMALPTPVFYWTSEMPLPEACDGRTIVIRDIGTLSPTLQEAWLAWLNARPARPAQVIATSSIAVFPLVRQGLFLEDLYYRLNTVLLDVREWRMDGEDRTAGMADRVVV